MPRECDPVVTVGTLAMAGGTPVRSSYLVFGQPVIEQPEIDEVVDSMRSRWIGTGPKVARFEEMVREYVGTAHAKALNSCTAGLHLSMLATGIGGGDEVITTPLTFAATVNAIVHTGAVPVLVDVDRASQNIDPAGIESAITPRTRAIIPVHMAGRPCDMTRIMKTARLHDLVVIEDAAHAIGAKFKGQRVGGIGDLAAFSFYATKNITTGEGGMVTTDNEEWARAVETYALHGLSRGAWKRYSDEGFRHYGVILPGYKYNMMDLQAAIGLHQFPRLIAWRTRREQIWRRYDQAFSDLPLEIPAPAEPGTVHARHLYTVCLNLDALSRSRDWFLDALHAEGIGTGVHFVPVHEHPYYHQTLGYRRGDLPFAEWIGDRTVSLPLSAGLSDADVDDVITAVRKVVAGAGGR